MNERKRETGIGCKQSQQTKPPQGFDFISLITLWVISLMPRLDTSHNHNYWHAKSIMFVNEFKAATH